MQTDELNEFIKSDGHLSEQAIALYAEALHYAGPELMPAPVVSHVEDCLDCKASIMDVVELIRQEDLPALQDHPYFGNHQIPGVADPQEKKAGKGKGGYLFFRIAAGLLLVSAISIVLMIVIKNISPQKTPVSRQDTAGIHPEQQPPDSSSRLLKPASPEAPLIAEAFTPNPALEKLISGQTRAWNAKLISPLSGTNCKPGKAIVFQWEYPDGGSFRLRILNHAGSLQLEQETRETRLNINNLKKEGLYYWFLAAEDDLIAGGKFTIGNSQ